MRYTGFNTSTLGYKLVSGQLKDNRKHSEQLNKYVAGLFDADGSISAWKRRYDGLLNLDFSITAAASIDNDFQMIRSLYNFYNMGRLVYDFQDNDVSKISWKLSTRESKKMFNLIGKHLRIKATHFKNLIELQESGITFSDEELSSIRSQSRKNSKWLKHPKHLSWAWLAGYLDGDGCYRYRVRGNCTTLCIKAASQDLHILRQLQKDFKGSILDHGTSKIWRRGLGKGHIKFSLPFLKKLRKYSCIERKYKQICKMVYFLESTQATKTKR